MYETTTEAHAPSERVGFVVSEIPQPARTGSHGI